MKKEIYLAAGCFWGAQEYFSRLNGVLETSVGYANGDNDATNYQLIKYTNHAEAVKIIYDDEILSLRELLLYYFRIIDPTSLNKQGNDIGKQYRTGIYYVDEVDFETIDEFIKSRAKNFEKPIRVEVEKLRNYVLAEEYHQDYLKKNPSGYCHIDTDEAYLPLIDDSKFTKPDDARLVNILTKEQYDITQKSYTERPFANEYFDFFEEGIYVDIVTGEPLFSSKDKFDSHCGWPSFAKPISKEVITYFNDNSHNMHRIEVKSRAGHSHLGHVFTDGPSDMGGLRYCINSGAIKFIPKSEMIGTIYENLIEFV